MLAKIGRITLRIIIGLVLVGVVVQLYLLRGTPSKSIRSIHQRVNYSSTPTLLIPGWGGNSWTYQKLIQNSQKRNIAEKALTVWVSPSGRVRVKGQLNRHNPMIQLLYDWNYSAGYHDQTRQLFRVMKVLHEDYGISKMNVVAHSYGGTEWLHAYIGSKYVQRNIRFSKVILLGAPVDESFNERTKFTNWLFKKSQDQDFKLMKKQVQSTSLVNIGTIYNWMGANGGRTDGEVPHIQSEMLRTLVKNKHVHYSEHVYARTNHVDLHQKNNIITDIQRALWYRE